MSVSQVLSRFLQKLLDTGIVIDDGTEKIVISSSNAYTKVAELKGAKRVLLNAGAGASAPARKSAGAKAPSPARGGRRRRRHRAGALTPQKLFTILEYHREGLAKATLARLLGMTKPKLAVLFQGLKDKGRGMERDNRYLPVFTAEDEARALQRKRRRSCTLPRCGKPHYAKGLCNNHYNIARRESTRLDTPATPVHGRMETSSANYKQAILEALRDRSRQYSLYELATILDKKWQTLRKDIQELISENKVVKDGKKYLIASQI